MKQSVALYFVIILFSDIALANTVCPDQSERLAIRTQHLNAQLVEIRARCPDLSSRIDAINLQLGPLLTRQVGVQAGLVIRNNVNRVSPAQLADPNATSSCENAAELLSNLESNEEEAQNHSELENKILSLYNQDPACASSEETQSSNKGNLLIPLALGGGALAAMSLTDNFDTTSDPVIPYNEADNDRNHNSRRREPPDNEGCTEINCEPPQNQRSERLTLDLLVIAQTGAETQASNVIDSFFTHSVFSCLGRNRFKTAVVQNSDISCSIVSRNTLSSTVSCDPSTFELANNLRVQRNAKAVLVIVNNSSPAGSFHARSFAGSNNPPGPVSIMTTSLHRQGGVHEVLHAVGFRDDYSVGNPPRRGGTIMNNLLYGYIPRAWNASIINFFGIEDASDCTEAGSTDD